MHAVKSNFIIYLQQFSSLYRVKDRIIFTVYHFFSVMHANFDQSGQPTPLGTEAEA